MTHFQMTYLADPTPQSVAELNSLLSTGWLVAHALAMGDKALLVLYRVVDEKEHARLRLATDKRQAAVNGETFAPPPVPVPPRWNAG